MQTHLETLTQVALLGTEKRALPALPDPLKRLTPEGLSPEESLLSTAGAIYYYLRVATEAAEDSRLQPEAAPAEEKPAISNAAAYYLQQMLHGQNQQFLAEFLTTVAKAHKRIPHTALPRLLELGRSDRTPRDLIVQTLSQRGSWLAQQNPEWSYAIIDSDQKKVFETGRLAEREAALSTLRSIDAQAARELLVENWQQGNAKERAALLKALQVKLSLADEAFLEAALDDKSKLVRRAAAGLLACLPESAYVKRMTQRAKPLLEFERGGIMRLKRAKLSLRLPDHLDAQAERDGLREDNPPQGMGKKAWCLQQILARVPLVFWTEAADLSTLLNACPKDDRPLLLQSWVEACERFQDGIHAPLLIKSQPTIKNIERLAPLLAAEQATQLANDLLPKGTALSADHPVLHIIENGDFLWTSEFEQRFLQILSRSMTTWRDHWQSRKVLTTLAATIPLNMVHATKHVVPPNRDHPLFNQYGEFIRMLEFRQKMIESVH